MQDFVTSMIRTGVPYLVGGVISWLATKGFTLTEEQTIQLASALTFVFGFAYYFLVRLLESKWKWFGLLLGAPVRPTYK